MAALTRTTAPAAEPLTLAEAKIHLRVSSTDDDGLITSLITAVRLLAEEFTRRAFVTQGWKLWLDAFPQQDDVLWEGLREGPTNLLVSRFITLPRPPLQSVTSVTSYDESNTGTVFAASHYFVDTASQPGRLALRNGESWPVPARATNGIAVDYVAGYGNAEDVPQALKAGMLVHLAHLYENRGDIGQGTQVASLRAMPELVAGLYVPYRIHQVG